MALINFQERFAKDVESGKKRQTIRKQRKRPFKLDEVLHLYTGLRTKNAKKIRIVECKRLEIIEIYHNGIKFGNGKILFYNTERNEFAQTDGFKDFFDMTKWFDKTYGLPFEGILIKW